MKASALLSQAEVVRAITLQAVESMREEEADVQPEGFNNTIRWHLGHIYLVQERLAFHYAGFPVDVPPSYIDLFGNGTKPSDWTVEPPSLAELGVRLQEQPGRIRTLLGEKLLEPPAIPFQRFNGKLDTIGAIVGYSLYHEGLHMAAIKQLKKSFMPQQLQ
ncbi:DinB family protein [Paenibacillus sp.]|uniref:DinB family protein n=1 Tax=Paenibacillus sp. TaxID=58172 RepID=UPI002D5E58BD|nr:DinB family protein [Paenibacillus sp.]HZG85766.1 DinB family protein [Paenibacillus sp.]